MIFKNAEELIKNGRNDELKKIRRDLLDILDNCIKAVDPYKVVVRNIRNINEPVYLLAFGKASVGMAQAVCDHLEVKGGIVITSESKKVNHPRIKTFHGDHPIPTSRNVEITIKAIEMVRKLDEKETLLVLISGGGSALFCKPRISIGDMKKLTELLLKSKANIREINTVRKHLSHVKGGQLARIARCRLKCMIISDVVGDPIEFIASGPTAPDSTTFEDAKKILEKYNLWNKVPSSVRKVILDGIKGKIEETPKPGEDVFGKVENLIVANCRMACEGALRRARELGYEARIYSTELTGNSREVGRILVREGEKMRGNFVLIAGGETTLEVKGNGIGGRNHEMVLSAIDLLAERKMVFCSFATDGIDGNSPSAGALADGYTLKRAIEKGLDVGSYLDNNDSYNFFKELGDYLLTGYTGTNVMDIQVLFRFD